MGLSTKRLRYSDEQRVATVAAHGGWWRPWLRFLLNFREMVVAMWLGMYLLAMPTGAVTAALGYSDSDPVVSALE